MMAGTIRPLSDAELRIEVIGPTGSPVADAVVEADVYNPNGSKVAAAVPFTVLGAGKYALPVQAAWSDENAEVPTGRALLGEYLAQVKLVYAATQQVQQIRYYVKF